MTALMSSALGGLFAGRDKAYIARPPYESFVAALEAARFLAKEARSQSLETAALAKRFDVPAHAVKVICGPTYGQADKFFLALPDDQVPPVLIIGRAEDPGVTDLESGVEVDETLAVRGAPLDVTGIDWAELVARMKIAVPDSVGL